MSCTIIFVCLLSVAATGEGVSSVDEIVLNFSD